MVVVILLVGVAALAVVSAVIFDGAEEKFLDLQLGRNQVLAQKLATTGVAAEVIVDTLQSDEVSVSLRIADGRLLGRPAPALPSVRSQRSLLAGSGELNGAELVLWYDVEYVTADSIGVRVALVVASAAALAVVLPIGLLLIGLALRPLRELTLVANRLVRGEVGVRLRPQETTSELGRAYAALDDAMDELETGLLRARQREDQATLFLSDAAHQLKTPMAGIQAAAESLQQLDDSQRCERQQLEYLLAREANRGSQIVADLLEAAKVDSGPALCPEFIDLHSFFTIERERLISAWPRLRVVVEGDTGGLVADSRAMISMLRNLLDNARRAMDGDGLLVIVCTPATDGERRILIADSGPGVPPGQRERIFDRLVRLDRAGGSGLGLPIARGYARAHGGEVRCIETPSELLERHPDLNGGGCFEVVLPVSPAVIDREGAAVPRD